MYGQTKIKRTQNSHFSMTALSYQFVLYTLESSPQTWRLCQCINNQQHPICNNAAILFSDTFPDSDIMQWHQFANLSCHLCHK